MKVRDHLGPADGSRPRAVRAAAPAAAGLQANDP